MENQTTQIELDFGDNNNTTVNEVKAGKTMENKTNFERAEQCARGTFQHNLLHGRETLGGSTLKGKAATYMSRYVASGQHLMQRLDAAGVRYHVERGPRGGYWCAQLVIDE